MTIRAALILALVAALLTGAGVWFLQDSRWETKLAKAPVMRDTIPVYLPATLPPLIVTPNPAPARKDTTMRKRVDSLLAVILNKDSLLAETLNDRITEQAFESHEDSAFIMGRVEVLYSPIYETFTTSVSIDFLVVPSHIIEITKTITVTESRFAWEWVVAGTCVGVVGGFLLGAK